jgi:Tfp pilus assembly protein PilW
MQVRNINKNVKGFSLIELVIAMTITITVMGLATTLIARSLKVRARENRRTDALADAQRGLNLMTREISNAGFRMKTNGIVWQDSANDDSIRILANLNKYTGQTDNGVTEPGEDVQFFLAPNTQYLVRYDVNRPSSDPLRKTVLANQVDTLKVYYFSQQVDYTTGDCSNPVTVTTSGVSNLTGSNIANAKYIVLALCVILPAEGTPGSPGYQPASQSVLASDLTLRNANTFNY